MPRKATIAADIVNFLGPRKDGATTGEIREALRAVRRSDVLPHSVRSALYQHLGDNGQRLFVKLGRGRYGLQKQTEAQEARRSAETSVVSLGSESNSSPH